MDIVDRLNQHTSAAASNVKVAKLLFNLRVAADAKSFGLSIYALLYTLGVEDLPELVNPPRRPNETQKVVGPAKALAENFGRNMYGQAFNGMKNPDKAEDVLTDVYFSLIDNRRAAFESYVKSHSTMDAAEKYVSGAIRNAITDRQRSEGRERKRTDKSDSPMETWESPAALRALETMVSQGDFNLEKVVDSIQRDFRSKGRDDLARDIPLYFDLKLDEKSDRRIIDDKMLPSLEQFPMSAQNWNKQYLPIIRKHLQKEFEKTASVEDPLEKSAISDSTAKTLNYEAQLEALQSMFVGNVASNLYEGLVQLHKDISGSGHPYEGILGFNGWDYGSPRKQGKTWSCRVWLKSSPRLKDGVEGNLSVEITFDDATVDLELVMDNRTSILKKSYSSATASPPVLSLACFYTWEKLIKFTSERELEEFKSQRKFASSSSELKEMQDILDKHGYNPKDAKKLQGEGMGPEELEHRIKSTRPGGVGSLEYTHKLKKMSSEESLQLLTASLVEKTAKCYREPL